MHLAKLIGVLKSFTKSDLNHLNKYIQSPVFLVYPPSVSLFNHLYKTAPSFTAERNSVAAIAKGNPALSTLSKQETAGSRLLQHVYNFIAYTQWQQNQDEKKRCTIQGLKALQLYDEYNRQFEKQMDLLNQNHRQDPDTFYEKHLLTELSLNGFAAKLKRNTGNSIMPVVETLDVFYALKKLRYLCEAINRKQFFGTAIGYHEEQIPVLLKILEPYTNGQHPYVYLFVNVYRLLVSDSYEDAMLYYSLIKKLANQTPGTPAQTTREAMGYAVNCLLNWYNKGYDAAGNEYLWWIDWRMKHGFLLEGNKLMPITFRNIISVSVSCYTPAQIENLIERYGAYLPREYSETYLAFASGLQQYAGKKYRKAMHSFMQAQAKEDAVFNSSIRRWQWMCTYDLDPNDVDNLFNQLQSFEKYLHRNANELQYVIPVYKIFIEYGYRLLKATAQDSAANLFALQHAEHFVGRPWLMEKLMAKNKKPVRIAHG